MGTEYRYPDRENPPPIVKDKMSLRGNLQILMVFSLIGLYFVLQALADKFIR